MTVSSIKKLVNDDDDDDDDDASGMKETDLEPEEMEELNMEKRLRQATKKMEEIVKQQLRDSGVLPSGMLPFYHSHVQCCVDSIATIFRHAIFFRSAVQPDLSLNVSTTHFFTVDLLLV